MSSVSIWINVQFLYYRFWCKACAMLRIGDMRSGLCWPSSPSLCVYFPLNWKESFSNSGNSQHLHRHQTNGATKLFAKILMKIGFGLPPTVSTQNPHLLTPRRQHLCCLGFEMTLSGWAAMGHKQARAAHLGTRLEQALLRCPVHTNTYTSAAQTKQRSSLWLNLLIYRKWF